MNAWTFLLYEICCMWLLIIFYIPFHRTPTELEQVRSDRIPPEMWAALEP